VLFWSFNVIYGGIVPYYPLPPLPMGVSPLPYMGFLGSKTPYNPLNNVFVKKIWKKIYRNFGKLFPNYK
jgi:hypothetical protein